MKREISKTPDMPYIAGKLQEQLTTLCFGNSALFDEVDVVFAYGTPYFIEQVSESISMLVCNNKAHKVIITGGVVPHGLCLKKNQSEAELVYDKISYLKDKADIYIEKLSTNTLENVTESLKIFDFSRLPRIAFIFPAHGARRGYLTLKKFCGNSLIFQFPYNAHYPNEENSITQGSWYKTKSGQRRIWGEYLRIKEYGMRGDIAYKEEVEELVGNISDCYL